MNARKPITIKIATKWSKSPTGRYLQDGKSNATSFRKEFIHGPLASGERFFIDLDGTDGYGSSFLDEAFAGLIRDKLVAKSDFFNRFEFKSDEDPSYIDEIRSYIDEIN